MKGACNDPLCHMQTYNNVLHVYGLHTSKEQLLPSLGGSLADLRRVDVYLQHSTALEQHGTHAVDLVCDSRSVLVGFSDASFQLLSWQSQVCTLQPYTREVPEVLSPICLLKNASGSASGCSHAPLASHSCMMQLKGKKSPFAPSPDEPQRYVSSRLPKRGSSGDLQRRGSSDSTTWQSAPSRQVKLPTFDATHIAASLWCTRV